MRKLAQADRMLGEGKDVADVCRDIESDHRSTDAADREQPIERVICGPLNDSTALVLRSAEPAV